MTYDVLRGQNFEGKPQSLTVSLTKDRLVFNVGPYAAGTLYVKTASGARTDGVIAAKFGPTDNYPATLLENATDEAGDAITFTADGSAFVDLVGKAYLMLVPGTLETGGTWIVEAWLTVQGDA